MEAYLDEISNEQVRVENSVLLVLKTKECEPCINELGWWNELNSTSENIGIYLIILEKYQTTFEAFLKHNNLKIKAFQDGNGIMIDQELVPNTPIKVYINGNGNVQYIEPINMHSNPESFYAKIMD